jgi:hypothetical protein
MAQLTEDRARTAADELERARTRLDEAFAGRDRCRRRYDAAIGTTSELGAYMRLRQASEHVSACDKWLRWVESDDFLRAPRPEHSPFDDLLASS